MRARQAADRAGADDRDFHACWALLVVPAASARIICAAFSATIIVGALVLPLISVGMMPASATRRPAMPRTPQRRVDDGVGVAAHAGGADGMEGVAGVLADIHLQRRIIFCAGLQLGADHAADVALGHDIAHPLHAEHQRVQIPPVAEIARGDQRGRARVGRAQPDVAAAERAALIEGEGETVFPGQPAPGAFSHPADQADRQLGLQIRNIQLVMAAKEPTGGDGGLAEHAFAEQGVLQASAEPAQRVHIAVRRHRS